MRAIILLLVSTLACANELCANDPGPGTGLVNGRGWVHCMEPGVYTVIGGQIDGKETTWCGQDLSKNIIGRFNQIKQLSHTMVWITPKGVKQEIPKTALYPPF